MRGEVLDYTDTILNKKINNPQSTASINDNNDKIPKHTVRDRERCDCRRIEGGCLPGGKMAGGREHSVFCRTVSGKLQDNNCKNEYQ